MNPLNEWANTFERWAKENNGSGCWVDGSDFLAIANDMRMDADNKANMYMHYDPATMTHSIRTSCEPALYIDWECTQEQGTPYEHVRYCDKQNVEVLEEINSDLKAECDGLRELAENLLMALLVLETPEAQQECIDRALQLRRFWNVLPMEHFDNLVGDLAGDET